VKAIASSWNDGWNCGRFSETRTIVKSVIPNTTGASISQEYKCSRATEEGNGVKRRSAEEISSRGSRDALVN
jgi:hypothetical protein